MRVKIDQRYKMGNKKLYQLGYGVKQVKEAMRWWCKVAVGPIWFTVEGIFGKNGVNEHQVGERQEISSVTSW